MPGVIYNPSSGHSTDSTTTIIIVAVVVAVLGVIGVVLRFYVYARAPTVPRPVVKAPQAQRRTEANGGSSIPQSRYDDTTNDWDPSLRRVFEANPQSVMEMGDHPSQPEESIGLLNADRIQNLRLDSEQDLPQPTDRSLHPEGVSSPPGDREEPTGQRARPIFFPQDARGKDEDWPTEMPPSYELTDPSVQPRR